MEFLAAVRVISPLIVFINPLFGALFAIYMDMIDWGYLGFIGQLNPTTYQYVDKLLDFYASLVFAVVVEMWPASRAKNIARALFLLRGIGVAIFFVTGTREVLVLFPNFFDVFFVFHYGYRFFRKETFVYSSRNNILLILALGLPKIVQEYLLHFGK